MAAYLICLIVGYFCGCISTGYFVGKFYHMDIRTKGSGNAGTTNVLRNLGKLPALERPTISPLSDSEWVALNTIVSEHVVRELIPDLKHLGASGIVEYPLNKIVE